MALTTDPKKYVSAALSPSASTSPVQGVSFWRKVRLIHSGLGLILGFCVQVLFANPAPVHLLPPSLISVPTDSPDSLNRTEKLLQQLGYQSPFSNLFPELWGKFLLQSGRWQLAEKYYTRACTWAPQQSENWLALSEALIQQGKQRQALEAQTQAVRLRPNDLVLRRQTTKALYAETLHLLMEQEEAAAWEQLEQLLHIAPQHPGIPDLIHTGQAIQPANKVGHPRLSLSSLPPTKRSQWGEILAQWTLDSLKSIRPQAGNFLFTTLQTWSETTIQTTHMEGELWRHWQGLVEQGKVLEAWQNFRKNRLFLPDSLESQPKLVQSLRSQADNLNQSRQYSSALAAFFFLDALHVLSISDRQQQAHSYAKAGEFQLANQLYAQIYGGNHPQFSVVFAWGKMWEKSGQASWALEKYTLAQRYDDQHAALYLQWGRLLRKEAKWSSARKKLLTALNLLTSHPTNERDSLHTLAEVQLELGYLEGKMGVKLQQNFYYNQARNLGKILLQLATTPAQQQQSHCLLARIAAHQQQQDLMLEQLSAYAQAGGNAEDLALTEFPLQAYRPQILALWK